MYVSIIPTPFFTQNLIYHKHFPHCLFLLKIYPGDHFIDVYKEMLLIPFCTCKILSIFYRGVIVYIASSLLISSFQSLGCVRLFAMPWTAARQASLSITSSWSLFKFMSIELVMPFNHLILCHPLLLLPSIFPNARVFSNESVLYIRWPKFYNFSFGISPSSESSGLISFRMDWLDLLAVQGTLKSLLQHRSLKASVLWDSASFIVQLSPIHDYWKNHSFD